MPQDKKVVGITKTQNLQSMREKGKVSAPLGSGARFSAIEKKTAAFYEKKGKSPAAAQKTASAVAAVIGAKKYGQKKMTKLAIAGKKK